MENQKLKSSDLIGRVKFYDYVKGYGFIESKYHSNLFFHYSALLEKEIKVGNDVCFHLISSRRYVGQFEAGSIRKVYKTKDDYPVFNRLNSHLHQGIENLLGEILSRVNSCGKDFIQEQVNFNNVIGKCILVPVNADDKIVYAVRKGRVGYTKFVLEKVPVDCKSVTIALKKVEAGYIIITAFVGLPTLPEPWDKGATTESGYFWKSHALVFGHEKIEDNTITCDCPWELDVAA